MSNPFYKPEEKEDYLKVVKGISTNLRASMVTSDKSKDWWTEDLKQHYKEMWSWKGFQKKLEDANWRCFFTGFFFDWRLLLPYVTKREGSGRKIRNVPHELNIQYLSFDRINNDKPHYYDNVNVTLRGMNRWRNDAPIGVFCNSPLIALIRDTISRSDSL